MKGLGDRHLGDRAAALVDGELGAQARDAALAHLAGCDACRAEVAAQRKLKARLAGLAQPPHPPDLVTRLAGLAPGAPNPAGPAGGPPRDGAPGGRTPDGGPPGAAPGRPPAGAPARPPRRADGRRPGARRRGRRTVRLVVAGGASLVALGVTAFAAGGTSVPTVVPDVHQLTVEHASTTGEVPFEVPIPGSAGGYFRQVSAP